MLILMQHGEAAPEDVDPDRPLTDRGRQEVERVAGRLARSGVRPDAIWHSGKLRARQTADLLAAALRSHEVHEADGLAPRDDPTPVADRIGSGAGDLILVGHLPHLSRLTSLLLMGTPDPGLVRFRKGGAVALERSAEGWQVIWFLTPEVA